MPGSCYSCATTFSVFKKEHGCKNCGYSFCKECLPQKTQVPKLKNEMHKVCTKCYNLLTGKTKPDPKNQEYSPPKALKKRMDVLKEKGEGYGAGPRFVASGPSTSSHTSAHMNRDDMAIAERLEKLKQSHRKDEPPIPSQNEMEERLARLKKDQNSIPPPSETDISERLARLRGQDPQALQRPYVAPSDHRSQQTQVDDLLQEICDEVEIDSHGISRGASHSSSLPIDGDIENNLNTMDKSNSKVFHKNIPTVTTDFKSQSGEDISFQDINRLMQEAAAELSLDAEQAIAGLKKDKDLWNRLQQLKKDRKQDGTEASLSSGESSGAVEGTDDDDEDEAAKKIIKQLMEESRLEDLDQQEAVGENVRQLVENTPGPPTEQTTINPQAKQEPEEDLWCYLCNDDADLRCRKCDDDLYCSECFKKAHKEFGLKGHKGTPVKAENN